MADPTPNRIAPDPARSTEAWAGRIVVLGVAFGLLAGLAELALLAVKKFGQHRILRVSRDVFWMAPLADILLCVAAGLVLLGLAWRFQRLRGLRTAAAVTAFPAILTILLHYRPLHIAAKLLLALGLAVQTGRLVARFPRFTAAVLDLLSFRRPSREGSDPAPRAFDAGRRRFLLSAASAVGGLTVGTRGWIRLREWQARPRERGIPDAPNVLLIVLDTVRAESLSLYGYPRETSPLLDARARQGAVFDRAYATTSWTLPSHGSLFTGRWHHEMSADFDDALDKADPTLAEVMARAGYVTAGFVANTAYTTYEHGLDRGFARYEDYRLTPGQILASSALGATIGCGNRNEIGCKLRGPLGWYELLGRKPANVVSQRFLDWAGGLENGQPFFAFLNFFDAHAPYLPPSPWDRAFGAGARRGNAMQLDLPGWEWTPERARAEQDAYDGAIAWLDSELERLLDTLDRRGQLANTLVIITSDHGEEFMEHGVMSHANSLYSPSLHVPLVLLMPGQVPGGTRIAAPVSIRDLPATVCHLVGVPPAFPGASLARFWREGEPAATEPLYAKLSGRTFRPAHYPVSRGDMHSVIADDWHYIRRGDGQIELFDLQRDPWERNDRSRADRSMTDSLAALLDRTLSEHR